jgi:hypothetical protein
MRFATAATRDDAEYERSKLWQEKYPETKAGVAGGLAKSRDDYEHDENKFSLQKSYSDKRADELGTTRQTVTNSIQRARDTADEIKPDLDELHVGKVARTVFVRLAVRTEKEKVRQKPERTICPYG